jgi:hypothetical protein
MTTDKKKTFGVVEGTLVYAKIAEPSTKYQSKDTEYTISVIVNEDTADAWDEEFKKQPAKKVKASEFETKYKLPLPDSLKGEKNVYDIKLKRDATKDGEDFYPENRPKVFVDYDNGDRVDITESRLIANGSYGKVSYRINSNDFGTFAKLANVLMDEEGFKEYVSTGGAAGSEFGDVKEVKKEAPRKEATQARASKEKVKEEAPEASDDDMSDAPF